jgi:hypothetical protein
MLQPVLLAADNFTPASRTPWGGTRLTTDLKASLIAADKRGAIVGESWEVSVEPDFPAHLDDGSSLLDYLRRAPAEALGIEHQRGRDGTALLVKLIDTAEALSVQIHPDDAYAPLAADESGKPESWYVVDAAPGAGLYLGFRRGVDEAAVRGALEAGASLEPLLRFVPVTAGDFFVIDAGTPHAIGAGLLLVEPQHVLPGKRGLTYRYWDWNRRYDAAGQPSASGQARPLHVDHALAVTAWSRVTEDLFVAGIRLRAGPCSTEGPARLTPLAGDGGLESPFLRAARLDGTGALRAPFPDRLRGITVLSGSVNVGPLTIGRGRSAVLPACAGDVALALSGAHALVTAVA